LKALATSPKADSKIVTDFCIKPVAIVEPAEKAIGRPGKDVEAESDARILRRIPVEPWTEKIDGETVHVLELTAVDRSVTYHRVLYWVRQSNNWPQKAEFYSLSDRLLKTCHYEDFRQLGGRTRPTRLVMQDALRSGEESVLEYADMRLRDLPDKMFTKDYLKRVE
jgi:hypothetical protein